MCSSDLNYRIFEVSIWTYNEDNGVPRSLPEDWNLAYPTAFLLDLCETGIVETAKFLRSEGKKPYPTLLQATAWLAC